ncbi:hypothetical protein CPB85DRAFT_1566070 [Mucidula mucida]|nr:hypothetical protein CPB85DRAFT_1566070 [Mucidula mucida]
MFVILNVLFNGAETTEKAKAKLTKDVNPLVPEFSSIFWAMVLVLLEGKDGDCTLWNGRDGIRLLDSVIKKDAFYLSAPEPCLKQKIALQLCYPKAKTKSLGLTVLKQCLVIREEDEAEPIEPPVMRESVPNKMAKAHNQCVRILPSLHVELLALLESIPAEELDTINEAEFLITRAGYSAARGADARSIIRYRMDGIECAVTQLASSLVFHPSQPDLMALLQWLHALAHTEFGPIIEEYASQNLVLHVVEAPPDELKAMNRKNKETYKRLRQHTQQLTSCMVFCTDALPVMEDMERLDSVDVFPWRLDSDYCGDSRERSPPPDAVEVPWTLPPVTGPRRSQRVRQKKTPQRAKNQRDIGVIQRPAQKDQHYEPACEDYIQKAWVHAVRIDATAVIFDCGNFVRIGIRHRKRQMLYLSSLIDIRTCKDPSYGSLWTALHIALASDAMKRLPLLENTLLAGAVSDEDPSSSSDEAMAAFMDTFPALAIFFRFDNLDSPAPLLLFRPDSERKERYGPKEYLKIIAYKRLGSGSVGDVYRAVIEPESSPSESLTKAGRSKGKGSVAKKSKDASEGLAQLPFILKIAPTHARARRLEHEVEVYRHLRGAGVSGIPNAGHPLGRRMDSDKKVDLSAEAGTALKSVLTAMHEAGVLHRDVRSWNIMEDDLGQRDSEDYRPSKERLDRFIAGEFVDKDAIIGADDLRRRIAPK